ncbi:MAG: ABC-2 transporter permease [Deltaproteobacteria bacterium]|nr:ABC-2 transporter permease [Deltaproteobacteria bacterium]MCW5808436.1 ABC-2 transporter permease [Deltaproteobacteria bacterium]
MRATSIIYKRELFAYLRSPFTWVIAAVLLLVDGILFQGYAMSGEKLSAVVLERFFYFSSGVAMTAGLLLSFRLITEERQTHSMVLLNTSPVRDSEIVLGKFLAALTFLAILLVLSLYMPLLIKVRGKVTYSQIMVGYLGLLLLGASALAIGLFASALARQLLVAAISATAILIVMVLLFQFSKTLDGSVRDVLGELDLWWIHFQNGFMRGVLNLKDVIYYLAVIYFFLFLAVKTLEAKRWQ